ncbi:MAG: HPr family phosphocarrier protein [Alphaproteobacteria bacterium]|nr:HPr family phosphocarrier protein [Alphaproteobacteria bacterium]
MFTGKTIIRNQKGLHARAAAKLVEIACQFKANIEIERNDNKVSAISIMGLLTLAASKETEVTIYAEGTEAKEAVHAIIKLIDDKFGEVQ